MSQLQTVEFRPPYLILIGDVLSDNFAKTGTGIVQWRREDVAGQIRFPECPVDLGVPDLSIDAAVSSGVRSLIIGVAPIGGAIPEAWLDIIIEAAESGIDIVSGLHIKLVEIPALVAAAQRSGARLIDVRTPPSQLPVANGDKRSGRRLLTVGTDCVVGKKYSALALTEAMKKAGFSASFRATGQTGIMIAGCGIPIDAVVSDFVAGAAELLSPASTNDHWDVIEGQGSLFHPAYAGVSMGLLHGSQPDAIVVCHAAERKSLSGWPGYPVPSIPDCIEHNIMAGRLTNPDIQCVGVCINTSKLPILDRASYLETVADETGLPVVDPLLDGCETIVRGLQERFQ